MLEELKTYGISKGYFEEKRICDFEDAISDGVDFVEALGIDFDKTAGIISNENSCDSLKSCDVLKFDLTNTQFKFMEFKQIEDRGNLKIWIEDNLCLKRKINDSLDILKYIIRGRGFQCKDKIDIFDSTEKEFIFAIGGSVLDNSLNRLLLSQKFVEIREIITNYLASKHLGENVKEIRVIKFTDIESNLI